MLKGKSIQSSAPLIAKQSEVFNELRSFLKSIEPDADSMPNEVLDVLHYVHQNVFDSDLSVGRIKQDCQIRNNNISSHFHLAVGFTIRDYIEWLRLRAAGRLLHKADVDIYMISAAVGYHHLETFYRAFKRMYGCTPLGYRMGRGRRMGERPGRSEGPEFRVRDSVTPETDSSPSS